MVRNGLWPTSVYNLGVGVAFLSSSLASDAKVLAPINKRVWSLADQLHIPRGISFQLSRKSVFRENLNSHSITYPVRMQKLIIGNADPTSLNMLVKTRCHCKCPTSLFCIFF